MSGLIFSERNGEVHFATGLETDYASASTLITFYGKDGVLNAVVGQETNRGENIISTGGGKNDGTIIKRPSLQGKEAIKRDTGLSVAIREALEEFPEITYEKGKNTLYNAKFMGVRRVITKSRDNICVAWIHLPKIPEKFNHSNYFENTMEYNNHRVEMNFTSYLPLETIWKEVDITNIAINNKQTHGSTLTIPSGKYKYPYYAHWGLIAFDGIPWPKGEESKSDELGPKLYWRVWKRIIANNPNLRHVFLLVNKGQVGLFKRQVEYSPPHSHINHDFIDNVMSRLSPVRIRSTITDIGFHSGRNVSFAKCYVIDIEDNEVHMLKQHGLQFLDLRNIKQIRATHMTQQIANFVPI